MLSNLIGTINEFLFLLTGGVPLFNTPNLFFIWIFFWSIMIALPMLSWIWFKPKPIYLMLFPITFIIGAFFSVIPVGQSQDMKICQTVEGLVGTINIEPQTILITECRFRDNYYEDFSDEWEIVSMGIMSNEPE